MIIGEIYEFQSSNSVYRHIVLNKVLSCIRLGNIENRKNCNRHFVNGIAARLRYQLAGYYCLSNESR